MPSKHMSLPKTKLNFVVVKAPVKLCRRLSGILQEQIKSMQYLPYQHHVPWLTRQSIEMLGELHTAHHVLRILPSRYFWSYRLNIQHNGEGCFNIEHIENYGFNWFQQCWAGLPPRWNHGFGGLCFFFATLGTPAVESAAVALDSLPPRRGKHSALRTGIYLPFENIDMNKTNVWTDMSHKNVYISHIITCAHL